MGCTSLRTQLRECQPDSISPFSPTGLKTYARIYDVYDGDTCKAVFKFRGELIRASVRLLGYDAPEMKVSTKLSESERTRLKKLGVDARNYLRSLILDSGENNRSPTKLKLVWIHFEDMDKYGRPLCYIYLKKGASKSVNSMMLESNHGYEYHGGTKKQI